MICNILNIIRIVCMCGGFDCGVKFLVEGTAAMAKIISAFPFLCWRVWMATSTATWSTSLLDLVTSFFFVIIVTPLSISCKKWKTSLCHTEFFTIINTLLFLSSLIDVLHAWLNIFFSFEEFWKVCNSTSFVVLHQIKVWQSVLELTGASCRNRTQQCGKVVA